MSQSKKNVKKHINAGSHGNVLISGSGPGTPTKSTSSPASSSGGATPTNLFGSTSSIIGQLKDGLKSMKDNEGKLGGVTEERDTKVPVNSKRRKYKKRKQRHLVMLKTPILTSMKVSLIMVNLVIAIAIRMLVILVIVVMEIGMIARDW
jgi:hypothetical protein